MINAKCIAILLLAVATMSACKINPQIELVRSGLIDVAQITQNPTAYIGKKVLVRNDAIATVGKRGLILDKDRVFSGDTILVITPGEISLESAIESTPEFLVSGTVEKLSLAKLQQQSGSNFAPNLYRQYENQPVIIADSVIFSPDPEDLTQNPEAYYGTPLAVKGELEDIEPYGIFELDEEQVIGGKDLVVVQPKPRIKLTEEQTVIVYGTLRPFITVDLERDYDLGWDLSLQQQIEAEYRRKPVLVADKIQLLTP